MRTLRISCILLMVTTAFSDGSSLENIPQRANLDRTTTLVRTDFCREPGGDVATCRPGSRILIAIQNHRSGDQHRDSALS